MQAGKVRFESLSNLEKRAVRDSNGQLIGRIDDVVIDIDSGRVSHLRLFLCAPGGSPDGWITVPWSVMRIRADEAVIEVGARREILKRLARRIPEDDHVGAVGRC